MNKPLDFYYWPTPNGWKISILLEELDIPYATHMLHIGKGEQFTPEFLAISPNNRMPAIVDHDVKGEPVSVFESGAIMWYLAEKTGKFISKNPIPEIAFSVFSCFVFCKFLLGSISEPTMASTSSDTLKPEPPLLTKLK